ncbi:MAG: nucleotidyltransferase family protein [Ktedonobacterales bacterium]
MGENVRVVAIVLAAGRSSRMGEHKLLLPLGGRPLVTYAVDAACRSSADAVIVVVGHNASDVTAALAGMRCRTIVNESYADGMATSLRAGIAALSSDVAGALVILADQPLVTSTMVNLILAAAIREPQAIHAASYNGKRGNPVYFPRRLFGELLKVSGDEGGRSVIARHSGVVRLVALPCKDAALDVDTPGEYERLVAGWEDYSPGATG